MTLKILFYTSAFILFYSYIGYGILLYILLRIKRAFKKKSKIVVEELPKIALLVAAYNERDFVDKKVANSLDLNYPKDKIEYIWVTDGSNDGTPELLSNYPMIRVLHQDKRAGKISAMNRAVKEVTASIILFSDANTMLGRDSLMVIAELFADPSIGCVAGEKRVESSSGQGAAAAGEGLYWRYESLLKSWDAQLYSTVGAAGELFAVRRELYREVERDTILDDFIISLRIAMEGYRIGYSPKAYATEAPSANIKEELKRKIRISAGGMQSIVRLAPLLNPFKYGVLSFQYISHRVLRWTLAPLSLIILFITNLLLAGESNFYLILFLLQLLFYIAAYVGYLLQNRDIKIGAFFVPYYFTMMNYALFRGLFRYLFGKQSVNWERAKRA